MQDTRKSVWDTHTEMETVRSQEQTNASMAYEGHITTVLRAGETNGLNFDFLP